MSLLSFVSFFTLFAQFPSLPFRAPERGDPQVPHLGKEAEGLKGGKGRLVGGLAGWEREGLIGCQVVAQTNKHTSKRTNKQLLG